MLVGVTLCAILSGHMATSFYKTQTSVTYTSPTVTQASDLAGLRVCGYEATFQTWYVPDSIPYTAVIRDNVAQCGALMQKGLVDVILMEAPMSSYYMKWDAWAKTAGLQLGPVLPLAGRTLDPTPAYSK